MMLDKAKALIILAAAGYIGWKIYRAEQSIDEIVDAAADYRNPVGDAIGGTLANFFYTPTKRYDLFPENGIDR